MLFYSSKKKTKHFDMGETSTYFKIKIRLKRRSKTLINIWIANTHIHIKKKRRDKINKLKVMTNQEK